MTHEKLKAAFVQGGGREASEVFNELIRSSVREAFWQMMSEEVGFEIGVAFEHRPNINHNRHANLRPVLTICGTSLKTARYGTLFATAFKMLCLRWWR